MSFSYYISPSVNCEYFFILDILNNLNLPEIFHIVVGIAHTQDGEKEILENIKNNKENILIQVSEETEAPYYTKIYEKFYKIFRTYNNSSKVDNKKIFPIPCGYVTRLTPHFCNKIEIPQIVPISNRKLDIIFTGHAHPSSERIACIQHLQKLKTNKKIVNSTNGFAKGYTLPEYYSILNNAKISAVPKGVSINESFRFFESFRLSCIVITTFPFKSDYYNKIWYYEQCPAVMLNNWSDLNDDIIDNILLTERVLEKQSLEYYNNKISPKAVACYITNKVLEKEV